MKPNAPIDKTALEAMNSMILKDLIMNVTAGDNDILGAVENSRFGINGGIDGNNLDVIKVDRSDGEHNDNEALTDRRYWKSIRALIDEKLCRLLLVYLGLFNKTTHAARILRRIQGTFHHVVIVRLNSKGAMED